MVNIMLKKTSKSNRPRDPEKITQPELIFGLVGPIGVDMEAISEALGRSLKEVFYDPEVIHITSLIRDDRISVKIDESSYYKRYTSLISYANELRKLATTAAALAGIAIIEIRDRRHRRTGSKETPAFKTAFIVRQFKRPEEIELMRRVYGRKFVLVSVFGSAADRRRILMDKIKSYDPSPKTDPECERQAIDLIDKDQSQKDDDNGQRLSEVFHLGDVFVDGVDPERGEKTIRRFIRAFFGDTKASPNKDEYGLYTAAAAALRSVDLSRQVGAAIFSPQGEVISLGCNEVPKAGGGTYWTDDPAPIFRDVELGGDPNQDRRNEIIYDLVDRLGREGFLSSELRKTGGVQKRVNEMMKRSAIKDAQVMDIIEFGRIIHAEMSAISDAARSGRAIQGATLFCTTFPCHLCAKHIVATGVSRVVYLEPYPKSYAQKLHSDSITFETDVEGKVLFEPFIGISPRRYRDIFEKKKRKDENGKARDWIEVTPAPLVEDRSAAYIENEEPEAYAAIKELRLKKRPGPAGSRQ